MTFCGCCCEHRGADSADLPPGVRLELAACRTRLGGRLGDGGDALPADAPAARSLGGMVTGPLGVGVLERGVGSPAQPALLVPRMTQRTAGVFTEDAVDLGLVAPAAGSVRFEPRHHVGIQP